MNLFDGDANIKCINVSPEKVLTGFWVSIIYATKNSTVFEIQF